MDKASITRFVTAIVLIINTALTALGYQVIPGDVTNALIIIAGAGWTIYTVFRNNYLTKKGINQKEVLKEVRLD